MPSFIPTDETKFETEIITNYCPTVQSAFYLPRQEDSIFVGYGLKCREYPDMPLISMDF